MIQAGGQWFFSSKFRSRNLCLQLSKWASSSGQFRLLQAELRACKLQRASPMDCAHSLATPQAAWSERRQSLGQRSLAIEKCSGRDLGTKWRPLCVLFMLSSDQTRFSKSRRESLGQRAKQRKSQMDAMWQSAAFEAPKLAQSTRAADKKTCSTGSTNWANFSPPTIAR